VLFNHFAHVRGIVVKASFAGYCGGIIGDCIDIEKNVVG
jgi:hypothetical protein